MLAIRISWTALLLAVTTLHASVFPTFHLDTATLNAFRAYTAQFEKEDAATFASSGRLWIDAESGQKRSAWLAGKAVVEPRRNENVAGGSIHHFSGAIHIPGASIGQWRKVMQDYPDYPKMFSPDVAAASAALQPDSTAADQHYRVRMTIAQSTLWIAVTYDAQYDTHYREIDAKRWTSRSASTSIRELRNPKDASAGAYPEGDDHGFLWRTHTYWFARERDGGLDLQVDSINLSRAVPAAVGWWGARRTRDAIEKMLSDTRKAIESLQ